MKRYLALLLTVLTLFGAFGASFPALSVSAAGDREYFFDFEKYSVGAQLSGGELVPSGFFHQVDQDMIGNNGRVYYLASRAGRGDTQLTLKTDYAEKLIEFDYLYSGDFDKIGGFYTAAYQNGNDAVYTIFSPVYHFQVKDSKATNSVLGDSGMMMEEVNVWYKAKIAFAGATAYAKTWKAGEDEPAVWNVTGTTTLPIKDEGSVFVIQFAGCGADNGNAYVDNIHVCPMNDEIRKDISSTAELCTVSLAVNDPRKGTVTGDGQYPEGNTVSVTAVPNDGSLFLNWTDTDGKVVSDELTYRFELTADTVLQANFTDMPVELRSFMAEGLTTAAEIDNDKKTVSLRFASDVDLKNVYPYFYIDGVSETESASFAGMDLSSGKATVGSGDNVWTVTAVQNKVMKTFYVNGKKGNDSNDGLSAEKAFATLGKAKEAVAAIGSWSGDVVVSIAAGNYLIDETLAFTAEDSAERGYAVIWQGATGNPNDVILSGGMHLNDGWKETREVTVGKGLKAWEYDAKNVPFSRDLYVNGAPAQIARLVLDDSTAGNWEMADIDDLKIDTSFGYIASGSLAGMYDWRNVTDLEFEYEVGWTYSIVPVEYVEESGSGSKITMKKSAFDAALKKGGVQITDPNAILFCFEGLDEKNEWYYDRDEEKLYYITAESEDPNTMDIVIPTIDRLISVKGEDEDRVYGFTLKDLRFEYTAYLRPHTYGQAEIQACYIQNTDALKWKKFIQHDSYLKTDGGITVAYAEGARVAHCVFTCMSASAFDYEIGCVGCQFVRNTIKNVGANGISVGGVSIRDAQPFSEKAYVEGVLTDVEPDPGRVTQYTLVFSNDIDGVGLRFKGAIAISVGHVADVTVSHNRITNTSYTGISIGWGWGAFDGNGNSRKGSYYDFPETASVQARYVVTCNDISNVCQRLADGGTIYSLSLMPGSRIVGNLMHDSPIKFGGIYFDEGSGGYAEIRNNIVYSVFQNYFYHKPDAFFNGREAACNKLMDEGNNFLGVAPKKGSSDPVYKAVTENAGCLKDQLPPEITNAPAHEHVYGEWTVVTAPTETAAGLEKRVCECGEEETREIPKLNPGETYPETAAPGSDTEAAGENEKGNTVTIAVIGCAFAGAAIGVVCALLSKKKKK
ncbi:MAG: hypothetical protein MJ070_00075 [Lachnospiraceae bacterium]|nr:hypothetical protein [Lachnospiraceae bacterium]